MIILVPMKTSFFDCYVPDVNALMELIYSSPQIFFFQH